MVLNINVQINQQSILMKGQILSRIQSYQNIPTSMAVSNNRQTNNNNTKLINEQKFIKYMTINTKQSPERNLKIMSPQPKLPNHKLLFIGNAMNSNKRSFNTTSHKDIKRSLNFQYKVHEKSNENKMQRMPKRQSQKQLPIKSFTHEGQKLYENQYSRQNILNGRQYISSQNVFNYRNLNSQMIKQANKHNLSRRKEIMKLYTKVESSKSGQGIGSEQNIRNIQSNQDTTKDPQFNHNREGTNIMMKTTNVFKDYKNSPYFNFSNKKFSIKSPQRKGPTKSLNRIPTANLLQKQQDVSIELSGDDIKQQQQQQTQRNVLQFGCSSIKQIQIDNDSSFLEAAQKNIINQLQNSQHKQQIKKKVWKKLPSDFLNNKI